MKLATALLVATAAEVSLVAALQGLAAVFGPFNPWLDVLAQLAPIGLVLSLAAGLLALAVMEAGVSKLVVLGLAAAGAASNVWLIAPEVIAALRSPPAAPLAGVRPLKVLTFNVWSDNVEAAATAEGIIRANADVVALQEREGLRRRSTLRLLQVYPYWTTCIPMDCDNILLSKTPWIAAGTVWEPVPSRTGELGVIWGRTKAPDGREFTLATAHYAWPFPPPVQTGQRAALLAAVSHLDHPNLILTGDFNLTPWSAALKGQDAGLAPLQRRTHGVFTWPANFAMIHKPTPFPLLPIDQIYAAPGWRMLSLHRLPRLGSDHYGLIAAFDRPAQ
jgi:endonuclease/exonuclease/phosphatase (EEP) superfamily protein YafD